MPEPLRYYVLFQDFDCELAQVGEAPTLEIAIQIALAVYAKPPLLRQIEAAGEALHGKPAYRALRGHEPLTVGEPVVAVYDREAGGWGDVSRHPGAMAPAQVFWLGMTYE